MRRSIALACLALVAFPGPARAWFDAEAPKVEPGVQAAFDAADKSLEESSWTRACDAFGKFLEKNPGSELEREAKAKRAHACIQAGRDHERSFAELEAIADAGGADLARAFASWALVDQGYRQTARDDEGRVKAALDRLKSLSNGPTGRWATQAGALYLRLCFAEIERTGQVDPLVERILDAKPSSAVKDHALYERARRQLEDKKKGARAEEELKAVGRGSSEWADDALYDLAVSREGKNLFVDALSLYDSIVSRFDPATSNRNADAASRAREIRLPRLDLSVAYVELPGTKPEAVVSFRNVKDARFTLRRADPTRADPGKVFDSDVTVAGPPGEVLRSFADPLAAPAPYAPGTKRFTLDVTEPGVYLLDVEAGLERATRMVLVTPLASVLKIGRGLAAVFTADAVTGEAVPGADVYLYLKDSNGKRSRLTGRADEAGLCLFQLAEVSFDQVLAWSGKGKAWSVATESSSWYDSNVQEVMAWFLADRPLYKPGETVGLKLFLRKRGAGPTLPVADQSVEVEVRDASSREIQKQEVRTSRFGTASWELKLPRDAQLGAWSVVARVANVSISYQQGGFRVEEYKPPEYFVRVEPVGSPRVGEKAKAKVSAAFYFGGPVANAQGRAIVTERVWRHEWGRWDDEPGEADPFGQGDGNESYGLRRHGNDWGWQPQAAPKTVTFRTGKDGTAILDLEPSKELGEGTDREFVVQVFLTDASRREVTGSGSVRASRLPFFADLRADRFLYKPGERIGVKLRAEDANGRPQSPSLEVRLVRLDEKGGSSEVLKRTAELRDGRGRVELDADAVGACRLEVRSAGGKDGELLASTDLWLTSDVKPIAPPASHFQILTDRAPLRVGGTVRALVVTPSTGGHALVTLEGERLWKAVSVEVKGRARFVELPLVGDHTPNVWLHAERLEKLQLQQTQAMVSVRGEDAVLDVRVKFPGEKAEPGTTVPFEVALASPGAKDLAAEVAVSVVDEAIFALEPERADPAAFFTRRRQEPRVSTGVSLHARAFRPRTFAKDKEQSERLQPQKSPEAPLSADDAAPSRSRAGAPAMAQMKAESAGPKAKRSAGAEGAPVSMEIAQPEEPVKVRANFASSAGWFPALAAKVPGGARTKATLPDSLTNWRAIAVAVTPGPHMGVGRGTIKAEKPLMVRLQAPRFFTERDEVTLSAVVTSRLVARAQVDVVFDAPGLKALGPMAQKVEVDAGGEARVDARFAVVETGDRRVRVTARSTGAADAMEWTLPAVVHGSAQRESFAGRLGARQAVSVALPDQRNAGGTRLELTVSPTLLGVILDSLPYLAQYPYGCVEQTLSRFVPAAIAARIVKRAGVPSDRVPKDLDDMVAQGLKRLVGFQHGDGGWGWWQADPTNRWMTAYGVYGLSLGREAGLAVDLSALERGRGYLASHLGEALGNPDEHGFMIFALASTGGAPKGAVDQAFERRTKMSPRARALLALSLLATNDARARIAVENLDDVIKAAKARPDASVGEANDPWSTSAAIEATAYTLMAIHRHDPKSPAVRALTDFLVLRRNGGRWRNTRDTAFAVYALSDLAIREEAGSAAGSLSVMVNGREAGRVAWKRGGLEMSAPVALGDAVFKPGANEVVLVADSGTTGYWSATWDVYNRDENVKGVGGDVKVARRYVILGRPGGEKVASEMEYGMALESGERVRVDVEVTANKAVEFVMIEDLKPAGLEAVAQRSGPEACNHACAHAELRTDRVAMFLTSLSVGTHKLCYELRAEVPGKFHALPARLEAMYAPEIRATSDEMRVEVRDAPGAAKGVAGQVSP